MGSYWNKDVLYTAKKQISPEDLLLSSVLPIKISEPLSKFEEQDLYKIMEMRCLNESGLVIVTNNTNFIKTKKIYNITFRGLV